MRTESINSRKCVSKTFTGILFMLSKEAAYKLKDRFEIDARNMLFVRTKNLTSV